VRNWRRPVTAEESAAILRLHHVEGWPVGTIGAELGRHHDTVEGVLAHAGLGVEKVSTRPRLVDPFIPFLKETLDKHPRLRASRLWTMAKARGYTGSKSGFRAIVRRLRPRPSAEAYLRRTVLPGQEAQIDWGHFGKLAVGRALRDLWVLVIVLSYSRLRFLRFSLRAAMPSFLRGHVEAFRFFGAVPRVILYDNLKSAVLEREGDAVRFNPTLLGLAGHYRFEPRACAPYCPNEKGRVERAIRDVRDNFFGVRVGKTPYVRFDKNDYSVPHTHVRRDLTVIATDERVRVIEPGAVGEALADHPRSYDRDQRVEQPEHLRALVEQKRHAHQSRGFNRLFPLVPSSRTMIEKIAERGGNLGATTSGLLQLLDRVGAELLERAVAEVVGHDQPHLRAVHHALDRIRYEAGLPPPLSVPVTHDERAAVNVRPHALSTYDRLHDDQGGDDDDIF
jgi:transposase